MIDTAIPDTVGDGLINFDKRRKEFEVLAQVRKFIFWFACKMDSILQIGGIDRIISILSDGVSTVFNRFGVNEYKITLSVIKKWAIRLDLQYKFHYLIGQVN